LSISELDLSDVPFVDNHAHALFREQPATPAAFRRHFGEAHSPLLGEQHVGSAVHFRWALRQLGALLGIEPTEESILTGRERLGLKAYARRLAISSGISHLLLDEGYPPPDLGFSSVEMEAMLDVRVERILRIETMVQDLILRYEAWPDVTAGFDAALNDAGDIVALKSIAAYRSGLAVERVTDDEARDAFAPVRAEAERLGSLRLSSKPLIDLFIWRAAAFAADRGLPFQLHTGYGDPDLDLRLANPLHLRPLFEDPTLASVPIILLHASYPFTAEAAYLCSVYPNAYLDIAFSLPPLDRFELLRILHIALGVAPASKLVCSSDGAGIPEHYYLGAARARSCLAEALTSLIIAGEISHAEAEQIGRMLLHENAERVYSLRGQQA
jgi:predicted TIM-barrel fold metal-dependent hydrolase